MYRKLLLNEFIFSTAIKKNTTVVFYFLDKVK